MARKRPVSVFSMFLFMSYRPMSSVLSFGISVWFGGALSSDLDQLEHIVTQASCIVGGVLSSIASLYSTRLCSRAHKLIGDPRHPANNERAMLAAALRMTKWEDLYNAPSCLDQYNLFELHLMDLVNTHLSLKQV